MGVETARLLVLLYNLLHGLRTTFEHEVVKVDRQQGRLAADIGFPVIGPVDLAYLVVQQVLPAMLLKGIFHGACPPVPFFVFSEPAISNHPIARISLQELLKTLNHLW
jgi:hypothetical protein